MLVGERLYEFQDLLVVLNGFGFAPLLDYRQWRDARQELRADVGRRRLNRPHSQAPERYGSISAVLDADLRSRLGFRHKQLSMRTWPTHPA